MNDDTAYFTDDITNGSAALIWRRCKGASLVLGPLLFTYILSRKILRWKRRAEYGVRRPRILPRVSPDMMPPDARHELAPFIRSFEEMGFQTVFHLMAEYIGNKRGCTVVLLDPAGTSLVYLVWHRITVLTMSQTQVVPSCHSYFQTGIQLDTAPLAKRDWHPEMIPPDREVICLTSTASPGEIVAAHQQRIHERDGELCRFTPESLGPHVLRTIQGFFDFMIERRYFRRLTVVEVRQLSG